MEHAPSADGAEAVAQDVQHQRDNSPHALRHGYSTRATPSPVQRHSQLSERHSPYPLRQRTPTQSPASTIQPRDTGTVTPARSAPHTPGRLQLTVQVMIKETVNKHDKSSKLLAPFVVTGNSFPDIIRQLWDRCRYRVTSIAVEKDEGGWSSTAPTFEEWRKVMQFRHKRHQVDHGDRVELWDSWVVSMKGKSVDFLVYQYGAAIIINKQLGEFQRACIRPLESDRAGATAESGVREVIQKLKNHWGRTFRAEAMPAPTAIAPELHPANSEIETHLETMNKSAKLALECVDSFLLQFEQLKRDYDALGHRFELIKSSLSARKTVIEGFVRNVLPIPANEVTDPLETMVNVDDEEHME